MVKIGDRVRVRNTLNFNGYTGVLTANSGHPEDFWDYNVELDAFLDGEYPYYGKVIGVHEYQVDTISDDTPTAEQYFLTEFIRGSDGYTTRWFDRENARLDYFSLVRTRPDATVHLFRIVQWEEQVAANHPVWHREKTRIFSTTEYDLLNIRD